MIEMIVFGLFAFGLIALAGIVIAAVLNNPWIFESHYGESENDSGYKFEVSSGNDDSGDGCDTDGSDGGDGGD